MNYLLLLASFRIVQPLNEDAVFMVKMTGGSPAQDLRSLTAPPSLITTLRDCNSLAERHMPRALPPGLLRAFSSSLSNIEMPGTLSQILFLARENKSRLGLI